MTAKLFSRTVVFLAVAASLVVPPVQLTNAQAVTDEIELLRGSLKADRKVIVAEAMQFTEAESAAFWPLYGSYRAEMEKLGDGIVKLVLEYADAYPNVPEEQAAKLLEQYMVLEKEMVVVRAKHLHRFAKVLSKSKVLRFAQVENRLDLVLRLQMASAVPLTPIEGRLTGSASMAVERIDGVPGGTVVQTWELTAAVAAIDPVTRKLTLHGPDGIQQTVKVGREIVNFDQIRVGDRLQVTVAEELVVSVIGEGEVAGDGGARLVALAPKGSKPGGIVADVTQVTAKVTALDRDLRKVTLQFEGGTTRTVAVRPDVDLSQRSVGDTVIIRTTEMLAISVKELRKK